MNTIKLSNVTLYEFRQFLFDQGCSQQEGKGGHEKWVRNDLQRPIVLQSHIDPVPEMVVRSNLRTIGVSRQLFEDWLLKRRKKH